MITCKRRVLLVVSLVMCLCTLCGVQAQTIQNGSKWWNGEVLYTATVRMGGVVYFQGSDDSELTIEKDGDKPGMYKIIPSRQAEETAPIRGEFGWRVQYIRQDGMNFLAVRNPKNNDACEVLVLTPDNLKNCQAQEQWAEEQPVSDIITGMLLNTTYLGRFSKDDLRLMRNEILARHGWKFQSKDLQAYFGSKSWYKPGNDNGTIKLNIIEQTNIQLIKSEESVPDVQRAYWAFSQDSNNLRSLVDGGKGQFPGGLDDDGRGPDEVDGQDFYSVTNESEFLAALGCDRVVSVAAGVHLNLSRVLEREEMFLNQPGRRWEADASAIVSKQPMIVSESDFDGHQLALVNMKNLIIKGEHNASIEVDPRYAYCLYFINCENCEVQNLIIGHTEGGYCSGGVIGVKGGRMTLVKDCDLYGCGTYGLDLMETSDFSLMNSTVHDCTYGIMQMRSCVAVKFNKCDFFNNREYDLIEGWGNEGVVFDDCRFFANWGDAPLFRLDNTFYLIGCKVYHPTDNLGSMKLCEQTGEKSVFVDNPLDSSIQGRGLGPK